MSEAETLKQELTSLRRHNAELLRRALDAEQAVEAFAHGEVDAVAVGAAATPVLLQAAQEDLRRNEKLLRAVFDGALDAMLLADDQGRYVDANPAACALFGLGLEQLVGRSAADFAGKEYDLDGAGRALHEKGVLRGRFPLVRPDGVKRTLDLSAVANVVPGLHLSVWRDITERIEAERAVLESHGLLEDAQAIAHVGSWALELGSRQTVTWSRESLRIFGLAEGTSLDAEESLDRIHPDDREQVVRAMRDTLDRDAPYDFDYRIVHPDGTLRWAHGRAAVERDVDGAAVRVVGSVQDVTERHRALAALRASEERYRLIIETTSEGVWLSDAGFLTTYVNQRLAEMLGYAREEMLGQSVWMFIGDACLDTAMSVRERRMDGTAVTYRCCYRRKDGSTCWMLAKSNAVLDERGQFAGSVELLTDVSGQMQLEAARDELAAALRGSEEQLRQAQKMEAVGRLAGGIAHDFNNLLSVILSYASLATDGLKQSDPLRDDLGEIQTAARRAADLTKQLLAFSRKQVLQPRVIDINRVIEDMSSMLRRLLGEDIELTTLLDQKVSHVLADPGQLEQVVMNLAVNARDAMPQGGRLTLATSNAEIEPAALGGSGNVATGEYVIVTISDSGVGMDASTCARSFEPFFTTKPLGKGTGLGLSTVFGIVRQSGGRISIHSEVGVGTTFQIHLPRTDRDVDAPVAGSSAVMRRGTETILLVEDEPQVRSVACTILRRNGYAVLETSNAGEAFLVSREHAGVIDLLLTDVVMPRMSGPKLAEELALQRPDMRVLFASGYTDDAIVHHGVFADGVGFIQKPFTPDALLRKVREALDA